MNKFSYILISLLIISCNQNPSQVEKEDLTKLEERVAILEKELRDIKSKTDFQNTKETESKSEDSEDYFTIGSTMDEVLEVMGEPSSYNVTAQEARKLYYGISSINFYRDKVISYDNYDKNLKVRVK